MTETSLRKLSRLEKRNLRKQVKRTVLNELQKTSLQDLIGKWLFLHDFTYDSNDNCILNDMEIEVERLIRHYERLQRCGLWWLVKLFYL